MTTLQAIPLTHPPALNRPPDGWAVRPVSPADAAALGSLYFESYPPGEAAASLAEAEADIRASFAGEYGDPWLDASLVAEKDGRLGAAVLTVHRAPWPDTPDCPFIIELFTAPRARRQGLARHLVRRVLATTGTSDRPRLALRVAESNAPALELYRSLGFAEVTTESDQTLHPPTP